MISVLVAESVAAAVAGSAGRVGTYQGCVRDATATRDASQR